MRALGWLLAASLVATPACRGSGTARREPTTEPGPAGTPSDHDEPEIVTASFRNVRLHVTNTVILDIRWLDGALISRVPGQPPAFDDQRSFTLRIDSGEIALSASSLTHLLNEHVFAYEDAPLSDLDVSFEHGRLRQKGTLHKVLPVPFTVVCDVAVTSDGRIRLRPTSVRTAGLPTGGLLRLLRLELDDLVSTEGTPAVRLVDNDFLIRADRLLPEPAIEGRLVSIRIEGDRLVQQFGSARARPAQVPGDLSPNHMYYRGGTLRFGKLTMSDSDMELIDADPSDPFDFFPARYIEQLTAGYSKNTASGGLRVHMPDFDERRGDLRPAAKAAGRQGR